MESIIKKTKLNDIQVNIDHAIAAVVQNRLVQICNRNVNIEETMKNERNNQNEILLLKVITPKIKKLCFLYTKESPYYVRILNYDIHITPKNEDR